MGPHLGPCSFADLRWLDMPGLEPIRWATVTTPARCLASVRQAGPDNRPVKRRTESSQTTPRTTREKFPYWLKRPPAAPRSARRGPALRACGVAAGPYAHPTVLARTTRGAPKPESLNAHLRHHQSMTDAVPLAIDLTDDQRTLLVYGLLDWNGPAEPTTSIAIALGFDDVDHLRSTGETIARAITDGQPLSERDWTRALAAAEVIFTSDLLGTGDEWTAIHGGTDAQWLTALRQLQAKLPTQRQHLGP